MADDGLMPLPATAVRVGRPDTPEQDAGGAAIEAAGAGLRARAWFGRGSCQCRSETWSTHGVWGMPGEEFEQARKEVLRSAYRDEVVAVLQLEQFRIWDLPCRGLGVG
jgi:hypothetical protein